MKTALVSVITATLLGLASFAGGRHFDAANFTAIVFVTGLVAWTIDQYSRTPRVLAKAHIIRFPLRPEVARAKPAPVRLAA